jgi:hypothetical protein
LGEALSLPVSRRAAIGAWVTDGKGSRTFGLLHAADDDGFFNNLSFRACCFSIGGPVRRITSLKA